MRLTPSMAKALADAKRGPLRRTHDLTPGAAKWPAHSASLAALVRHGLLHRDERRNKRGWPLTEWTITAAGSEALEPPPPKYRQDRPVFLADRARSTSDYTTNWARAIDDLEITDQTAIARHWASAADERHAEATDRRTAARAVRQRARRAA